MELRWNWGVEAQESGKVLVEAMRVPTVVRENGMARKRVGIWR